MSSFKKNWNSELCAEHDGTIASFRQLKTKLDDIEDFEVIFERETVNIVKVATIAGTAAGGIVVAAPLAVIAAPAAAAAAGSLGLLGTASTGTAIAGLHGAALTSASLAAIGGGTMAGGVVVLSAAGAALGATQGAVIGNAYFGEVDGFRIRKLNEGTGPAVIFVNGFLQEKEEIVRDWRRGLRKRFSSNPWYHLQWESKTLSDIGSLVLGDVSGAAAAKYAVFMAKRATKKAGSKFNPATWTSIAADLIKNPWHTAMVKASMTGALLADLMARTRNQEFILMGHSLGARVVYYALQSLSTRRKRIVSDAYLFGGAVDRRSEQAWESASRSVKGTIFNCFTSEDMILKGLYRTANAFKGDPVGLGPIAYKSGSISNEDFSDFVSGHMKWKGNLRNVFDRIDAREAERAARSRRCRDAGQEPRQNTTGRCQKTLKNGNQCKRKPSNGAFCWQHS